MMGVAPTRRGDRGIASCADKFAIDSDLGEGIQGNSHNIAWISNHYRILSRIKNIQAMPDQWSARRVEGGAGGSSV